MTNLPAARRFSLNRCRLWKLNNEIRELQLPNGTKNAASSRKFRLWWAPMPVS
jgi:hypothetical protein